MSSHNVSDYFKQLYNREKSNSKMLAQALEEIKTYLNETKATPNHQLTEPEIKISNILHAHKLL